MAVALWAGVRASARARLLMYGSAVLVSVSLFLPLPRLRAAVPAPLICLLDAVGARWQYCWCWKCAQPGKDL